MGFLHLALCLVIVHFFGAVYCQDPEIVNDILPDVKRVGMTARLNCTVARLSGNSVQWSFKGPIQEEVISVNEEIKVLNPRKGGVPTYRVIRIEEQGDRTTFQLIISRLMPEYSGDYQCTITVTNENFENWTRKTGKVTVLQPPMIRPGSTDSVRLIEKGGSANITCDAFGVPFPNITWVRSDGKLLPNGKAIYRGRTMNIKGATVSYAGVYRCVADNSIKPPAESLTQVYVMQEPTARVLQDSVGQYANGRLLAKLDCIVQGYPTPTVYWMIKDGGKETKLTDSDKYETTKQATDNQNLMNGEQWYTMTIRYVQAGDFRDYYCVGTNSKGVGQAVVTLFSTWDCQGPLCYSLDPDGQSAAGIIQLCPLTWILCLIFLLLRNNLVRI